MASRVQSGLELPPAARPMKSIVFLSRASSIIGWQPLQKRYAGACELIDVDLPLFPSALQMPLEQTPAFICRMNTAMHGPIERPRRIDGLLQCKVSHHRQPPATWTPSGAKLLLVVEVSEFYRSCASSKVEGPRKEVLGTSSPPAGLVCVWSLDNEQPRSRCPVSRGRGRSTNSQRGSTRLFGSCADFAPAPGRTRQGRTGARSRPLEPPTGVAATSLKRSVPRHERSRIILRPFSPVAFSRSCQVHGRM